MTIPSPIWPPITGRSVRSQGSGAGFGTAQAVTITARPWWGRIFPAKVVGAPGERACFGSKSKRGIAVKRDARS